MLPVAQSRLLTFTRLINPNSNHMLARNKPREKGEQHGGNEVSLRLIHFLGLVTTQKLYSIKLIYSVSFTSFSKMSIQTSRTPCYPSQASHSESWTQFMTGPAKSWHLLTQKKCSKGNVYSLQPYYIQEFLQT